MFSRLFGGYVDTDEWSNSQDRGGAQIILERSGCTPNQAVAIIEQACDVNHDSCPNDFERIETHFGNYYFFDASGKTFDALQEMYKPENEDVYLGDGRPVKKGWFSW